MIRGLIRDAKNIRDRDPAARNLAEVILLYPGFHVLVWYRIAHWFYRQKRFFLARFFSQIGRGTGIEIHPGAKIGKNLFIDHGMGIVIGETAEIGDNCTLYHGVTLGGTGKDKGKRHPTIGNNVLIATGAKILGPFTVGDNSNIGANAIVLQEVPNDSTVVGDKARVVKRDGKKIVPSVDLDQIHMPDPQAQEIRQLIERISKLESQLNKLKSDKIEK